MFHLVGFISKGKRNDKDLSKRFPPLLMPDNGRCCFSGQLQTSQDEICVLRLLKSCRLFVDGRLKPLYSLAQFRFCTCAKSRRLTLEPWSWLERNPKIISATNGSRT